MDKAAIEIERKLTKMDEHLLEAFDHIRYARDLMDDKICRNALDSCNGIEKAEQIIEDAMVGLSLLLRDVQDGSFEDEENELEIDKPGMTLSEAAKAKGLDSFDTALPGPWVKEVMKSIPYGMTPMGNIVWCYRWDVAEFNDIWGRPVAVTPRGELILGWLAVAHKA